MQARGNDLTSREPQPRSCLPAGPGDPINRGGPKHLSADVANGNVGVWFALPWLVGVTGLVAVPVAGSLFMSFLRWDGLSLTQNVAWVGLGNYRQILTDDPLFGKALSNSLYYSLVGTPLVLIASLAAAVLLSHPLRGI
ncbi:MAG: carbohydrate ABC transporter permease, partial [Planctomycetota bacterium]